MRNNTVASLNQIGSLRYKKSKYDPALFIELKENINIDNNNLRELKDKNA